MAADEVREHYGIKVYASFDEEKYIKLHRQETCEAYGMNLSVKADVLHNDGDVLNLAGFDKGNPYTGTYGGWNVLLY